MTELPIDLRPVIDSDLPHFFDHSKDEEAIRMAKPVSNISDWPNFCHEWDRVRSSDAFFCRTVVLESDVVGYLAQFDQMELPSISYWFGRQYWGNGIARQALKEFVSKVDIRPLYARVASCNYASLRVLTLNGFNPINTGSYFSAPHGQNVDELVMRLDS